MGMTETTKGSPHTGYREAMSAYQLARGGHYCPTELMRKTPTLVVTPQLVLLLQLQVQVQA
jgi:hypothetical protein